MSLLSRLLSQNMYFLNTQKYLLVIYLIIFSGHRTPAKLDQLLLFILGRPSLITRALVTLLLGKGKIPKEVFQIMVYRSMMIGAAVVVHMSENKI